MPLIVSHLIAFPIIEYKLFDIILKTQHFTNNLISLFILTTKDYSGAERWYLNDIHIVPCSTSEIFIVSSLCLPHFKGVTKSAQVSWLVSWMTVVLWNRSQIARFGSGTNCCESNYYRKHNLSAHNLCEVCIW